MRIHIFQHDNFESPAIIEDWIKKKNYSLTFTKFYENGKLPELDEIDWLIIMGGPMGAYDDAKFHWLIEEKNFIRNAVENGKIILGICLGSQLIAAALGAKVYPNNYKEIGWLDVNLTENSNDNFLFHDLPETIKVCQWHGDTFELPDGAINYAKSEGCKNQAFIFKDRVIGLQFHLEFTENTLDALIRNGKKALVKNKYVQTEEEIKQNTSLIKTTNDLMFKLLDRINSKFA